MGVVEAGADDVRDEGEVLEVIDLLENHGDVQSVSHNAEIPESVMA